MRTSVPQAIATTNSVESASELETSSLRCSLLMGLYVSLGLAGILFAPPLAADSAIEWSVSTYDVYVDGALRTDATVLRASEPERYAVLLPEWRKAWVLEGEGLLTLPRRAFSFEDPRHATTRVKPTVSRGSTAEMGDGQWLSLGKHQMMILSHQGGAGPLSVDELWQRVPLWRELRDAYVPDTQAVTTFAEEQRPLRFQVAFGSWCGDSRRSVPRLLKTLDAADNSRLEVELLAIGRGFTEPMDQVRELRLTNVPTVIVYEGDREIGRFVENAYGDSIEHDLAALLAGRPLEAPEHYSDDDRLLAFGELSRSGEGNQPSERERWRLFATDDDGQRLWVERHDGAGTTEVWQRFNADGQCTYAEVTRRSDSELSRTRLSRRGSTLTSTTRGNVSGIVRHVSDLPEDAEVVAPTLISTAFASQFLEAAGLEKGQAFLISPVGEAAPGRLEPWTLERLGNDERRLSLAGVDYLFPDRGAADSEELLPRRARVDGQRWASPKI